MVILLVVDVECTLSFPADPTNSALERNIFLLQVCLQHMDTYLVVQLTGIIACGALVGHPAKGTRICPYTHSTILGSQAQRAPLRLCLMDPEHRLCPWQTLPPYIRLQLIMVYNFPLSPGIQL